jgi:glycine oxidase
MDVVVVGGGLIGLAIAWRARQRGMDVTVCDPTPGRGASWAAAGMLAPVTEAHYGEEGVLELNLAAAQRFPAFAAELEEVAGRSAGYRACGALVIARDQDDHAALSDLFAFQQRLGLGVERLRSRECRALEPGLTPAIRSGILVEGDHQVDNRALVEALLAACANTGVDVRAETVAAVDSSGGRVRGVALRSGEVMTADAVVVAAGWTSDRLEGVPPLPLRPVKGQLLHLQGDPEHPLATRLIRGLECYVVPRGDGRVVLGATMEERGADLRVTAGGVRELLRAGRELLPDIDELELVETIAGLRPATSDNAPLLGPTEIEGLLVAAGHFRHGVLQAPVTADEIVDLLASGKVPALIAPFGINRFAA